MAAKRRSKEHRVNQRALSTTKKYRQTHRCTEPRTMGRKRADCRRPSPATPSRQRHHTERKCIRQPVHTPSGSIPLPLWTFLPHNPAYSFVGYITSRNRLPSRQLNRSNSMSELTKVAAEIDRQHWWYKWFLSLAFFAVVSVPWRPSLVAIVAIAIPLPLISLSRMSLSESSYQGIIVD